MATAVAPAGASVPAAKTGGRARLVVAVAAALVLIAGGGGFVAGKSASGASGLKRQLASSHADLTKAQAANLSLRDQNTTLSDKLSSADENVATLQDKNDSLQTQVDAANGFKSSAAPAGDLGAPSDSLRLGAAGATGELLLKPTAFERVGSSFVVTISAKNTGASSKDPFCGGSGASMTDSAGRTFDGDSVLADNTANCGDSLQPGMISTYKMSFKAPANTKPAFITLWDSDSGTGDGADGGQNWSVK